MQGLGSTIYSAVAEDEDNVGLRRSSSWGGAVRETWANDDARLSGGTPVGARTPAGVGKLKKGGKWLSDLDVRRQIAAENPLLKRRVIGMCSIWVHGGMTSGCARDCWRNDHAPVEV